MTIKVYTVLDYGNDKMQVVKLSELRELLEKKKDKLEYVDDDEPIHADELSGEERGELAFIKELLAELDGEKK